MTTATKTHTPTEKLAREFARLIVRDLTAAELKKVIARNTKQKHDDICHSHDFLDANMAMYEAFNNSVGRAPDTGGDTEASEADVTLWNDAWDLAKKKDFFVAAKGGR